MNKILITTIILLAFLGCNTKKEKIGQQKKVKPIADGELLTFSDSLQIKLADKLTFIESYEDKLLFHATRYGIILTDFSGNKIHEFNPVGGAENEIGYQMKQICFTKEGNIAIASERGVSIYDQNGNFNSRIDKKFPYSSEDENMYSFNEGVNTIFITNVLIPNPSLNINSSIKDYYEKLHTKMVHFTSNNESKYIFPFPTNSDFRKFEEYFLDIDVNMALSKENSTIGIVFNPDRRLFLFELSSSFSDKGFVVLSPPDFVRPFTHPFENGRADVSLVKQAIRCNSRLLKMTSIGNYVYIAYRKGLSTDFKDSDFGEVSHMFERFIIKVDIVNKKQVGVYSLPNEVFELHGSFNNQLVFSSKTEGYDYETFYLIDAP